MKLQIAAAAARDIDNLLFWSEDTFGRAARRRYQDLIKAALIVIAQSDPPTSRPADDIAAGLRVFHLRNTRPAIDARRLVAKPRHFLLYRRTADLVTVLRVLHDASDLASRFLEEP